MKGKHMKAHQLGGNMSEDTRIALLEQSIKHINQTLIRLESKIDNGFDKIDLRFHEIAKRVQEIDKRISDDVKSLYCAQMTQFKWVIATLLGLFGTILLKGHGL
jgi:predicted  nucleic acid-binding Zn-ribbon protein